MDVNLSSLGDTGFAQNVMLNPDSIGMKNLGCGGNPYLAEPHPRLFAEFTLEERRAQREEL